MTAEVLAPAKINLTLHVTGQRPDGYHLLDSLVMFADIGDRLTVTPAAAPALHVTGPMAEGVPADAGNLALRAAALMGVPAEITLEKHLPVAAGIGGGSSDAAAVLRALARQGLGPVPDTLLELGADMPVCLLGQAARMAGIGERLTPLPRCPALDAVLVHPGVRLPTAEVFAGLAQAANPPMPQALPPFAGPDRLIAFLALQRNDLEPAAIALRPVVAEVLAALGAQPGCGLARMSGSGATCVGLFDSAAAAERAAERLQQRAPGWWVRATRLS